MGRSIAELRGDHAVGFGRGIGVIKGVSKHRRPPRDVPPHQARRGRSMRHVARADCFGKRDPLQRGGMSQWNRVLAGGLTRRVLPKARRDTDLEVALVSKDTTCEIKLFPYIGGA